MVEITPTPPSPVEGEGYRAGGQRRVFALHDFLVSGINFSPQGDAATVGESECVTRQRVNASDFGMILAEDNTEKSGG